MCYEYCDCIEVSLILLIGKLSKSLYTNIHGVILRFDLSNSFCHIFCRDPYRCYSCNEIMEEHCL